MENIFLFQGSFEFVLSSHLLLLPPSYVVSVVALPTTWALVCLSIRKGSKLAQKPNMDVEGVEFYIDLEFHMPFFIKK